MLHDLRLAARGLLRSPIFTILAVGTLAVGIAATASLFALVNGLLRDPLPYPEPDRLVEIWGKDVGAAFARVASTPVRPAPPPAAGNGRDPDRSFPSRSADMTKDALGSPHRRRARRPAPAAQVAAS
jgi:hypothetical protein